MTNNESKSAQPSIHDLLDRKQRPTSAEHVEFACDVCSKLDELVGSEVAVKKLKGLAVDIADTYSICLQYCLSIDRLMSLSAGADWREIFDVAEDISRELEIHLPNHRKPLVRRLKRLAKIAQPDKGLREDYSYERSDRLYESLGLNLPEVEEAMAKLRELRLEEKRKKERKRQRGKPQKS